MRESSDRISVVRSHFKDGWVVTYQDMHGVRFDEYVGNRSILHPFKSLEKRVEEAAIRAFSACQSRRDDFDRERALTKVAEYAIMYHISNPAT